MNLKETKVYSIKDFLQWNDNQEVIVSLKYQRKSVWNKKAQSSNDNVIYDMFMRLNANSITLNRQELRITKYWRDLKVLAYHSSSDWRSFF